MKFQWTDDDLARQFKNLAPEALAAFQAAESTYLFPTEILLGIGSRETNLQNIKGDFHNGEAHGYGIMQVDIGTDPKFCTSGDWHDVAKAIDRGCQILKGKRDFLIAHAHGLDDAHLLMATISAYNTGEGNVWNSIKLGRDPDSTTTGANYAMDVLHRAAVFKTLLTDEAANEQPNPPVQP